MQPTSPAPWATSPHKHTHLCPCLPPGWLHCAALQFEAAKGQLRRRLHRALCLTKQAACHGNIISTAGIVAEHSPGYDAIPDLVKRQIFAKVLTASHKVAAVAAMPPDKRQAYIPQITEKVAAELTPGTEE